MQPFGPLVLRLTVGAVFAAHGAQKLFGVWGGGGPDGTAAVFAAQGLTPAYLLALLVGFVELAGGLLLIAGAYTLVAAGLLLVTMALAIWRVQWPVGFFLDWTRAPGGGHGHEFNLVLIGGLASLILAGPGTLSVDGRRARSAESEAAGRARLRRGRVT